MSDITFQQIALLSVEEKRALLAQLLAKKEHSVVGIYPLSYGQRALWFMHQLAPESGAYNESMIWRIRGNLDMPTLQRALQALIDRHAILRTVYVLLDNQTMQKVMQQYAVQVSCLDAVNWSQEYLDAYLADEVYRPIDLCAGPVFRVQVLRLKADEYLLMLITHHIAIDLWSFMVLLDELDQVYRSLKEERSVNLPPLCTQYHDYVRWQQEMLAAPQGDQLWHYWREQLSGQLPVLELPTDYARSTSRTFAGAVHAFTLKKQLTLQLKALAQAQGVTLYTLLLSALHVLLYRYTRQDDILIGSLTNGRQQAAFDSVVGYFVNPVVMRAHLTGAMPFRALLHRTQQTVMDALDHQAYPFPLLVSRLSLQRDQSHSPLYDVAFIMEQVNRFTPASTADGEKPVGAFVAGPTGAYLKLGGLDAEWINIEQNKAKFDISLEVVLVEDVISAGLQYKTDLFHQNTIASLARHFHTLLESIVANPDQPLGTLALFSPEDAHRILDKWNATEHTYARDLCLHELLEAQVCQRPDAIALSYRDQLLTYQELDGYSNMLAHWLLARGLLPGQPVGLCLERSLEMAVGLLAILKSGGVYVPLDPQLPRQRLAFIVHDTRMSVVLTHSAFKDNFAQMSDELFVACLDQKLPGKVSEQRAALPTLSSAHPAYIIYTSGSTGTPKGVLNTHRALHNRLSWMVHTLDFCSADRFVQKTPFSFDASLWEFFVPWMLGSRLVLAQPGGHQDSSYLRSLLRDEAVTVLQLVPSMLSALLQDGLATCSQLRHVFCGGEALSLEMVQLFSRSSPAQLHNLYGPTEASIDVTYWRCEPGWKGGVPIGLPIANTQLYLLDERLQPVPQGASGELYVGGEGLALGYLNRPELTAEKFLPHPWSNTPGMRLYKTGDKARYRANGLVEYLGRVDHQVKLRGYRIEPGEIEALLNSYPVIQHSVVTVRHDNAREPRLVAYVIPKAEEAVVVDELRRFLRKSLPFYMIPAHFIFLTEFPRMTNGKLDYRALPPPRENTSTCPGEDNQPRTPTESVLCQVCEQTLGIPKVLRSDNFFDLGGHSLLATQVINRLREVYHVELPVRLIFESSDMAELASLVDAIHLAHELTAKSAPIDDSREEGTL